MRSRRSNALALVITACVLLVVTLIVFATVPGEMVVR